MRRVDLRLIPLLTFLYVLSFLDRSNIANANVAGMSETLGLVGNQYNIANTGKKCSLALTYQVSPEYSLLLSICAPGSSEQYHLEVDEAEHLDYDHDGELGNCDYVTRHCSKLPWPDCYESDFGRV